MTCPNVSDSDSLGYPFDTVDILLGNGDGTFRSPLTYAAGYFPYDVKSADLDGDGWPDLVVANDLSDNVSVMPHLHPTPELTITHFNAISGETFNGQLTANDPFGLPISFSLVSHAASGSVSISKSGQLAYTSPPDFIGMDHFVVSVGDGRASSQGKIYVTVKPPAPKISAPVPMAIQEATSATKTHGGPESFTIEGTGSLTVDTASDNTSLIATNDIVVSPATGPAGTRQVTVSPEVGRSGTAIITLTVNDTYGQSASSNFKVAVSATASNSSGGGGGVFDPYSLLALLGACVWMFVLRRRKS